MCLNINEKTSRVELNARSKIPKLEYRRTSHIRNSMFKRKDLPRYRDENDTRTRRQDAVLVKTKRANCSAFERSVYYHGAKEWNNLPVYIRNITSYEEFKLTQKRWLLSMLPAL